MWIRTVLLGSSAKLQEIIDWVKTRKNSPIKVGPSKGGENFKDSFGVQCIRNLKRW